MLCSDEDGPSRQLFVKEPGTQTTTPWHTGAREKCSHLYLSRPGPCFPPGGRRAAPPVVHTSVRVFVFAQTTPTGIWRAARSCPSGWRSMLCPGRPRSGAPLVALLLHFILASHPQPTHHPSPMPHRSSDTPPDPTSGISSTGSSRFPGTRRGTPGRRSCRRSRTSTTWSGRGRRATAIIRLLDAPATTACSCRATTRRAAEAWDRSRLFVFLLQVKVLRWDLEPGDAICFDRRAEMGSQRSEPHQGPDGPAQPRLSGLLAGPQPSLRSVLCALNHGAPVIDPLPSAVFFPVCSFVVHGSPGNSSNSVRRRAPTALAAAAHQPPPAQPQSPDPCCATAAGTLLFPVACCFTASLPPQASVRDAILQRGRSVRRQARDDALHLGTLLAYHSDRR